jgi:transposase
MTHARDRSAGFAARYLAGASLREIAEAANVSHTYVKRALERQGVALRPTYGDLSWQARIPPLFAAGLSCVVIAERLGKHRSTVVKAVRRLGLREPRA